MGINSIYTFDGVVKPQVSRDLAPSVCHIYLDVYKTAERTRKDGRFHIEPRRCHCGRTFYQISHHRHQ